MHEPSHVLTSRRRMLQAGLGGLVFGLAPVALVALPDPLLQSLQRTFANRSFREGKVENLPFRVVKRNGEIIDVLLSAIVEYDDSTERMTLIDWLSAMREARMHRAENLVPGSIDFIIHIQEN